MTGLLHFQIFYNNLFLVENVGFEPRPALPKRVCYLITLHSRCSRGRTRTFNFQLNRLAHLPILLPANVFVGEVGFEPTEYSASKADEFCHLHCSPMVVKVQGFEPRTQWLKATCSDLTELHLRICRNYLCSTFAPVVGLEPTHKKLTASRSATELHWNVVERVGIEPTTTGTSHQHSTTELPFLMVGRVGLEPTDAIIATSFTDWRATNYVLPTHF